MNTSTILININNLSELDEYKKVGITNFLFAVKDLSIGYNSFDIDEIPSDVYLLINRVFDTTGIDEFKKIIPKLDRFKGVVFEDIGVFNLLKDKDIELIWNQAHFVTNYSSINNYFKLGCTSCVISNELTFEEIDEIINKANKKVVFNVFGKNMIMYSRRSLVSNFNSYASLDNYNDVDIKEKNVTFHLKEDKYGTAVFNKEYFNYINILPKLNNDNILYHLVLNLDLTPNEIIDIINGKEYGNDGFLNKKTTFRMKEYDDRRGDK